jgi:hypothetical protein
MSEHRNGSRHAVIIIDKRGSFAGDTVARNRSRHVLAHARVVFVYSHLFEPFFLGDAFNAIKTHRFVRNPLLTTDVRAGDEHVPPANACSTELKPLAALTKPHTQVLISHNGDEHVPPAIRQLPGERGGEEGEEEAQIETSTLPLGPLGTQFTCFTGTKVQILTTEEDALISASDGSLLHRCKYSIYVLLMVQKYKN